MLPYSVISPNNSVPIESLVRDTFGMKFSRIEDSSSLEPHTRYLCLCALTNIWMLERAYFASRKASPGKKYILDLVSAKLGDDLRSGRCFLVLDKSGEGHPFVKGAFDDLHAWCAAERIDPANVALLSQNRRLEAVYRASYLGLERSIQFLTYDSYPATLADLVARDDAAFQSQFGFAKSAPLEREPSQLDHLYLCLNATPRPLRVGVLAALDAEGLLPKTLWSLLNQDARKDGGSVDYLRTYLKSLDQEALLPRAESLLNGPPCWLDRRNITNATRLSYVIDYEAYNRTFMSIVTETEFSDGTVRRITEKLLKPLVMAHPAVVFGNPGSLDLAKEFGFQTFAPLFDESYDRIASPTERFRAVLAELKRIDGIVADRRAPIFGALAEICQANAAHARSGSFRTTYQATVVIPLIAAFERETNVDPATRRLPDAHI